MASIYYGWWIVLACSAITTYNAGILFYGFTAFFNPLIQEFGWSRAATSFAFGLYRLEGGLAAPIVGFLLDRWGPRKMMTVAVIVVGLGFILLSRINSLASFYAVFLFIAFGTSLGFSLVGTYTAANWFAKKRGIALGIYTGGISLCGFLVPVLAWIITTWGWRTASVAAGLGMWIIGLPLAMVIRWRPEQYGLLPDGDSLENNSLSQSDEAEVCRPGITEGEFTFREAIKTKCFWLFAIALIIPMMCTAALFVHEMPFLLKAGIPVESAAFVVTGTVLISGLGRVGFGWMSDRFNNRLIMSIALVCQSIGLLLFANIHALWQVIPFIVIFSVGYGGMMPVRFTIQAECFGTVAFGSILGLLYGIWTIGTILGPVIAGRFFDITGDYRMVFVIFGIITLISIPLIIASKPPR